MTETTSQQTSDQQNADKGLYLYAIIKKPQSDQEFASIKGLSDRPLQVVEYQDLAALVSDATGTQRRANRDNLLRHASVLDQVLDKTQLLPFRFGLIADDEHDLIDSLIKPHYDEFMQTLSKLHGKEELGLKVYWNEKAVLNEIVEHDQNIKQLRDQLAAKASDPSIREQKIELGRMVGEAVDQKRDQLKTEVMETLGPLSEEFKENKLLSENMVLNAAFLVPEGKEGEFGDKLKKLDEKLHDFLTFRYVPEAPPYNFVSINIQTQTGANR